MNRSGPAGKVPVILVTGFLGAGKTTFLNAVLSDPRLRKCAVIVNEFGKIGLDHHFVHTGEEPARDLADGCLCCTGRSRLADAVAALPESGLDRVVIETSGVADPSRLLQWLTSQPDIAQRFRAGPVVTLIDARHASEQVEHHWEARAQIALADALVVTRWREARARGRRHVPELELRLRQLNPQARMVLYEELAEPAGLLLTEEFATAAPSIRMPHSHLHAQAYSSVLLRTERPTSAPALTAFCDMLSERLGADLLRIKGLVALGKGATPVVVHGVRGIFDEPTVMPSWPDGDRTTRLVAITDQRFAGLVEQIFAAMFAEPSIDMPDRDALADNPLAIPGLRLR